VRLRDIRSVWYRHPSHFVLPDGMSSAERRHAAIEARVGVAGVLSSLDVLWVNYPSREADALKPRQLDVARRCGLSVPETLVTNRPDAVRSFAKTIDGPLATKNLSAATIAESGGVVAAFTRRLEAVDLDDLRGVEATAHLFQVFIGPLSSGHQCTTRLDLGRGLVRAPANRAGGYLPLMRPDVIPREGPRSSRVVHWCTHRWRPRPEGVRGPSYSRGREGVRLRNPRGLRCC